MIYLFIKIKIFQTIILKRSLTRRCVYSPKKKLIESRIQKEHKKKSSWNSLGERCNPKTRGNRYTQLQRSNMENKCVKMINLASNLRNETPFCTQNIGASNNKWWCACGESGGIQVGVLTGTTDKEGIWEYIKYTTSILNLLNSTSYFTQKKLICMKLMMMKLTGMKKIPTQVIVMEMKTWQQLKYQREIIQLKYIYTMDA